jgi:hypothetical protein
LCPKDLFLRRDVNSKLLAGLERSKSALRPHPPPGNSGRRQAGGQAGRQAGRFRPNTHPIITPRLRYACRHPHARQPARSGSLPMSIGLPPAISPASPLACMPAPSPVHRHSPRASRLWRPPGLARTSDCNTVPHARRLSRHYDLPSIPPLAFTLQTQTHSLTNPPIHSPFPRPLHTHPFPLPHSHALRPSSAFARAVIPRMYPTAYAVAA